MRRKIKEFFLSVSHTKKKKSKFNAFVTLVPYLKSIFLFRLHSCFVWALKHTFSWIVPKFRIVAIFSEYLRMVTAIFVIIDLAQSATKDFIFNVRERQFNAFDIDKTKIYHILINIAL